MHEPKRWGGSIVAALGVGLLTIVAVAQGTENEPWYVWAVAAFIFAVGLYVAAAPGTRLWVLPDSSPVSELHAQQLREISSNLVIDVSSGTRCVYRTGAAVDGDHVRVLRYWHAAHPGRSPRHQSSAHSGAGV